MTNSGPAAPAPKQNTDRELWRERPDDYYADSIFVTEGGGIGVHCGGTVYVKPVREWHRLAGGMQGLHGPIGAAPAPLEPPLSSEERYLVEKARSLRAQKCDYVTTQHGILMTYEARAALGAVQAERPRAPDKDDVVRIAGRIAGAIKELQETKDELIATTEGD